MNSVLLITLLAWSIGAHNWVTSPITRNANVDSVNTPCDIGTKSIVIKYRGDPLGISWTTNHPNADHSVFLVPSDQESTLESLTQPFDGPYGPMVGNTMISIPNDIRPGSYVAQYRWDVYRNCVDITILARPPANAVYTGVDHVYSIPNGVFDASTGNTNCQDGFVPAEDGSCVSSGGRTFGILLLVALIFAVVGVIGYFVYLKLNYPNKYEEKMKIIKSKLGLSSNDGP